MLFNSPTFLFFFLPIVLLTYVLIHKKYKNFILIIASLFFYTSAESSFIFLLIGLVLANYIIGITLRSLKSAVKINNLKFTILGDLKTKKNYLIRIFIIGIIINLIPLVYFKYLNFFIENINSASSLFGTPLRIYSPLLYLPLAISFFTFHSISYLIDIYKNKIKPEVSLNNLLLYFLLFPHLIAGPIIRFAEIKDQLQNRQVNLNDFSLGLGRFIMGLTKKVLLADTLAGISDEIFSIQPGNMSIETAWVGLLSFTLQIYFDFSGYSDMAIGLARMFGFKFPENFNYPYTATSIREFWTRWHMTLYRWFRDYIYIPLGGNKISGTRTTINIMIVFILTGLWHGAGWNFIIWGGIHGLALIFERTRIGGALVKLRYLSYLYTIFIVMMGWVFFRSETLAYSLDFLRRLFNIFLVGQVYKPLNYIVELDGIIALALGIIISFPIYPKLRSLAKPLIINPPFRLHKELLVNGIFLSYLLIILIFSIFFIAGRSYQSFIYFKF